MFDLFRLWFGAVLRIFRDRRSLMLENLTNSKVGSCNYFFGACSAFTHVTACTLAESPSDPLHRELRQLCCLRCRLDCFRVERTSSRAGVSPAEVQRLSRRTISSVIIPYNKGGTSMSNGAVAQILPPTEDELKRMRDLWSALKQKPLPASTETGIELQTYLAHAARMV